MAMFLRRAVSDYQSGLAGLGGNPVTDLLNIPGAGIDAIKAKADKLENTLIALLFLSGTAALTGVVGLLRRR